MSLWIIWSVAVWAGVDSAALPHDTTAQTPAPNESLLHRLGLQMTSFTQDGSSHAERRIVHLFFTVSDHNTVLAVCHSIRDVEEKNY